MTNCVYLMALMSILTFFPSQAPAQSKKDFLDREEYSVYSAVIIKNYIGEKEKVRLVIVTTPTCCEVAGNMKEQVISHFRYSPNSASAPAPETIDSYTRRNKTSVPLRKSFRLNVKYQIVPYKRIESLFDMIELENDWKTFYRKYPQSNGYLRLSRVGFNRAGDEALVSTAWMCGSLCGEGRYILLRKKHGLWKIEADVMTWVS